jgi:hypothetical protein
MMATQVHSASSESPQVRTCYRNRQQATAVAVAHQVKCSNKMLVMRVLKH